MATPDKISKINVHWYLFRCKYNKYYDNVRKKYIMKQRNVAKKKNRLIAYQPFSDKVDNTSSARRTFYQLTLTYRQCSVHVCLPRDDLFFC